MAEQDQDDTDAVESEHDSNDADDGMPGVRRPMNAFFIFCKRHRDVVREKYPHLENRSITKILGEWWANLDSLEKSSYTALAKQYKEAFMKAHPDFKWYKLPTPPTRTLVTRPTNRCMQTKRDKNHPLSSGCGITLGKLADDAQLGGLSSLISPSTSASTSSSAESHDTAITSSTSHVPTVSSTKLLKPPKKRYLVNGEFKCHSESPKYDNRDHQTQNACSALLELAEICASSATQTVSASSKTADTFNDSSIFSGISSLSSSADYKFPLTQSEIPSNNTVPRSSIHGDSQKSEKNVGSRPIIKPAVSLNQSVLLSHCNTDVIMQQQQEQPLNLSKEKEKTIRGSNQQLIDHLVDKFLCDPPVFQGSQYKSVLESSFCNFSSSNKPPVSLQRVSKDQCSSQSFTLSAAIESAVDQAYNINSPKAPKFEQTVQGKTTEQTAQTDEVPFVNKIKKACIANSKKASEISSNSLNSFPKPIKLNDEMPDPSNSTSDEKVEQISCESPTKSNVQNPVGSNIKTNVTSSFKRTEVSSGTSKYYSKFITPPKKSRIWCNIFMNEQLKNRSDSESDKRSAIADLSSPVRRNSQRTCKGRRYQALITEGLLQSTKERKPGAGKKLLPTPEKVKTKSNSSGESPPAFTKSKKRKKDSDGKTKVLTNEDVTDFEKNVFDLDEKIASLPKCSIETLNKKKKLLLEVSSSTSLNPSSPVSTNRSIGVESEQESSDIKINDSLLVDTYNEDSASVMSSGRYKTGSFDLEQHIASLPKCDIEVLNKRRNKKD